MRHTNKQDPERGVLYHQACESPCQGRKIPGVALQTIEMTRGLLGYPLHQGRRFQTEDGQSPSGGGQSLGL